MEGNQAPSPDQPPPWSAGFVQKTAPSHCEHNPYPAGEGGWVPSQPLPLVEDNWLTEQISTALPATIPASEGKGEQDRQDQVPALWNSPSEVIGYRQKTVLLRKATPGSGCVGAMGD